ncbi:transcriptional regulator [Nodosilinea sp. FACHB-141]|uniref:helix-turn-helix domain-containing transcriptional regulator n=1 Tax=Nodosilinea sp. FACHB-141 TaxID=2692833 RepID=UPI0019979791|nr:transcriptional regulator [Nodosilinea sp. FACHB-141]
MPVKDYRTDLLVRLANPDYAALYLKTALDEALKDGNREAFVLALRNVVEARQITQESNTDGHSKPLQRVLAEGENPTLETFVAVLNAVGLTIDLKPA